MTADLPPNTAERLVEVLDYWWLSKRDTYEIMERLLPTVAQLVAEGAADALADLAEVLMAESGAAEERVSASVMEALVHRNAGAANAYEVAADMADSRAVAIRQGRRA